MFYLVISGVEVNGACLLLEVSFEAVVEFMIEEFLSEKASTRGIERDLVVGLS